MFYIPIASLSSLSFSSASFLRSSASFLRSSASRLSSSAVGLGGPRTGISLICDGAWGLKGVEIGDGGASSEGMLNRTPLTSGCLGVEVGIFLRLVKE